MIASKTSFLTILTVNHLTARSSQVGYFEFQLELLNKHYLSNAYFPANSVE